MLGDAEEGIASRSPLAGSHAAVVAPVEEEHIGRSHAPAGPVVVARCSGGPW